MGKNNGIPGAIIQRPGQYVTKQEDIAAETKVPGIHRKQMMLCNAVIYVGLTGCALILGKIFLVSAGVAFALATTWGVALRTWPRRDGSGERAGTVAPTALIGSMLLAVALVWGPHAADLLWVSAVFREWVLRLWAIGGILFVFVLPHVLGLYRHAGEEVDSNGPTAPRAAIDYPGVVWPWLSGWIWERMHPPEEEPPEPKQGPREPVMIIQQARRPSTLTEEQQFALDLRAFLRAGALFGFSRRRWIRSGMPRHLLVDTGNSVTRGYYEKLRDTLQDAQILSDDGDSPSLLVPLDEALAAILEPPTPPGDGGRG